MTAADPRGFALFLDFDGTLVDIVDRPDAVVPPVGLTDTLRRLRDRLGGAVAIVTGRSVAEVERFLPDTGLDVHGMHGIETRSAGIVSRPEPSPAMRRAVAGLQRAFADRPGIVIEDKGIGVAIHWRLAPDLEGEARAAIDDAQSRLGPDYKLQDGKAVAEIVLARSGKGHAIRTLMAEAPYLGRVPIFAGDDKTDEHGFEAVNSLGGISIKVGTGPTVATMRVASPGAVVAWLEQWSGITRPAFNPP